MREELFVLVLGRVVHELLKDPFEVGKRIEAVASNLFDEGVDHRTAPTSVLPTDEHPILGTEFRRADSVLGEVVVQFDLTVQEAGLEMRPLLHGVGQRFPKVTLGKDARPVLVKVSEEFL